MNYYYLISTLPDINLELKDNHSLNFKELFGAIERNLSKEDLPFYQALLYQNDNRNLLNIIFHEYHDLDYHQIHLPSVFSANFLNEYKKNISFFPQYMIEFLQDYEGLFSTFSLTEIELKLRAYFRDHIEKLNSTFLMQFYEWQTQFERMIAHINQRKFDFLNTPLFDIEYSGIKYLPKYDLDVNEVTTQLQPYIDNNNYLGMEKVIDSYYWKFTEGISSLFTLNEVLSYTIKLLRLARWEFIPYQKDKSKDAFLHLLEDLKKTERSPKMPVL